MIEHSRGIEHLTAASVDGDVWSKVVTKGAGFTPTVQVRVDGIPFVAAATVKNGTKVTQKGNLLTGQSVQNYLAANGGTARMTIRNASGATVTRAIP